MTKNKEPNSERPGQGDGPLQGLPKGMSEKFSVAIDAPDGPCFIEWVGGMPEREHAFFYHDKDYQFYFYAKSIWEGSAYDVDVENATVSKFTGPAPGIKQEDFARIAENIRTFFEQRMFLNSSKPRPETEQFRNLVFSWRIK